ncbi:hypothetical protein [Amphritea sp. HPY]|uniref:hypothetical protein n=1 Tax=Amphritea sp. HPY TaxID=3421652 RepID=UPI003D7E445B
MLRAILQGKAGRVDINGVNKSWRSLFQEREDLLSAAIFSRLSYLREPTSNQLLIQLFPDFYPGFGRIVELEFWPRWRLEGREVEPDVLMRFEHCELLVEVKRPGGITQNSRQWQQELDAFFENISTEKPLLFLALGGLGDNPKEVTDILSSQLQNIPSSVWVKGTSWQQFYKVLKELALNLDSDNEESRIINDMIESCELYGIREYRCMDGLNHLLQDLLNGCSINQNLIFDWERETPLSSERNWDDITGYSVNLAPKCFEKWKRM